MGISIFLIIVIFGLLMGFLLVVTDVSRPGLAGFPMLGMVAQSTIIASAAFFLVRPWITLPQIFFVMVTAAGLTRIVHKSNESA